MKLSPQFLPSYPREQSKKRKARGEITAHTCAQARGKGVLSYFVGAMSKG